MPTEPRDWLALVAVVEAFEAVDGTGDYATDISAAVAYGQFAPDRPPRQALPCVAVGIESVDMEDGPDLPGTRCQVALTVQGWAQGASDSAAGRMQAACELASDLRLALRTARASGSASALYNVHEFAARFTVVDARQLGISITAGYVAGSITLEYPVGYGETE